MQDYIYSTISSVALIVHLITNYDLLLGHFGAVLSKGIKEYRAFLVCLLCYYVSDVLWGVFAGLHSTWLLYIDTVFYYLTLAVSVQMLCRYAVVYLEIGGRLGRVITWTGRSIVAFHVIALIVNLFNGSFFYFNAYGAYVAGPIRHLAFYLLLAFNGFCAAVSFISALKTAGAGRRRNITVFLFCLTMAFAIVLQVLWPLLPLYAIGCLIGSCLLHVHVLEDEKDELRTAMAEAHHKAESLESARLLAAAEQDRADKQRRMNETLEVLIAEPDLSGALDRVMAQWCEALGAQWCYMGRWDNNEYVVVHCYAAPGEEPLYENGARLEYFKDFNEGSKGHGDSDYVPMVDFIDHPIREDFVRVCTNSKAMRLVTSCYSHVVRQGGKPWGTLCVMYRPRHPFTANEELLYKSAANALQLALARQRFNEQLKAERDRALEAEKARSQFFSSVSHDLRTPLNAIVGLSELLDGTAYDAAERARYISTIRASGKMLSRLLNDILDLSKLETGTLEIINEPTDVPAIVREVISAFEASKTRKPIVFRADTSEMPRVEIDAHRVRQLLYNFVSNAFKYTDRGTITLRTRWQEDGTLELSVADTGRGISKADIDRILQPFVQLVDRNHRDGTGLGLSICQRLANLMGGTLTITSEVGQGSTFTVTFAHVKTATAPSVSEQPAAVVCGVTAEGKQVCRRVSRALVVDDSSVNRVVLKAMLVRNGITDITMAENGKVALEILAADTSFDIVLTDLWMPELDGEGLALSMRADPRFVQIPVYLVTADVEAVARAHTIGFAGILLKPITNDGLRALLAGQPATEEHA